MFTTAAIRIYFTSPTLICKLLFIRRISLETKISILNSQILAFWGTPCILAIKILKAKLQTSFQRFNAGKLGELLQLI